MSPRILAVALLLIACPLCAETYKWVDERGVTNYSDNPPANAKMAKKAQVVDDRLSVYTPDPALIRAIEVRPPISAPLPYGPASAYPRQQYPVAAQSMYDDCMAQRYVDCSGAGYPYAGYFPYIPVFVVAGHVRRAPSASRFHARTLSMASSFSVQSARMSRASWSK
jgi:hypothetical protein